MDTILDASTEVIIDNTEVVYHSKPIVLLSVANYA